jgi:hypothetical protein
MAKKNLQLNAGCPPGQSQPLFVINPDGTSVLYSIPAGGTFNLTDISIVIATAIPPAPPLISVGLTQVQGAGSTQRWNFAGYLSKNFERNFTTPIVFSKDFQVWNSGGTYLNFNIFGYQE